MSASAIRINYAGVLCDCARDESGGREWEADLTGDNRWQILCCAGDDEECMQINKPTAIGEMVKENR
jgi:hypothetical protein